MPSAFHPLRITALAAATLASAAAARPDAGFLRAHCLPCHGDGTTEAGLDLREVADGVDSGELGAKGRSVLRHAIARAESGEMPPPARAGSGLDALADADRDAGVAAMRRALRTTGPLPAPRGAPPRRLNRAEYRYAVQDLLGIDPSTLGALPPDDVGAGFDNVAAVLSLPPSALERYAELAEAIAARACPDIAPIGATLVDAPGSSLRISAGRARGTDGVVWSRGSATATFTAPVDGVYEAIVRVGGMQAGPEPVRMAFEVDGKAFGFADVPEPADEPGERRAEFRAAAGSHQVGAAFLNDYFVKEGPGGKPADRNMVVQRLTVRGPVQVPEAARWLREMQAEIVPDAARGADDRERAEFAWLAGRFLRRPATDADVAAMRMAIEAAAVGASREERMRAALGYCLVHPEFLFRIEPDPQAPDNERTLDGHELATRLAAFLWSSVPDGPLLADADAGRLGSDEGLRTVVERMLEDARASRLAERFAPQWLAIDGVEEQTPDPRQFPGVGPALLGSMRAETVLYFDALLREGRPVSALLGAGFTFVDTRLAQHYGVPEPEGGGMRRVPAPPGRGAGVLSQASVLLCTSNPTRTSPVKRGKWVLEALLDAPPPPPPPGTPQLPDAVGAGPGASMRELLAAHRADAACAACHRRMDALGFAFEAWDPVGRRRDRLANGPVDDRGELPGGRVIAGTDALREELLRGQAFARSLLRHLTTYALGRECTPEDDDLIDRAMERLGADPTLRDAVIAVAEGPAMRRRGRR